MGEKPTLIDNLPDLLLTPDRQFSPRTPHTYAHVGQEVLTVASAYPDLPATRQAYRPLPTDTERTLERLDRLGRLG